jgi:putative effector of murein hydrolase LrgA (UPF0299 family)
MSWYSEHKTRIAVTLMVIIAVSVAAAGAIPGWVAGLWLLLAYVAWRAGKRRRGERVLADLNHEPPR